jgi:hypothetical protein
MSAETQDYAAFRASLGLPPPADGEGPGVLPLPLPTHAPIAVADDLEPELEDMTLEPGASNALTRSPKHVSLQMDNWADAEDSDDEAAPAAAEPVPYAAAAAAPAAEAVPNAAAPAPAPSTRSDADDLLATCLAFDDDADDAPPASAPPDNVEPFVHDHSFDYEAAERLPPKPKFSVETARAAGEFYDRDSQNTT